MHTSWGKNFLVPSPSWPFARQARCLEVTFLDPPLDPNPPSIGAQPWSQVSPSLGRLMPSPGLRSRSHDAGALASFCRHHVPSYAVAVWSPGPDTEQRFLRAPSGLQCPAPSQQHFALCWEPKPLSKSVNESEQDDLYNTAW